MALCAAVAPVGEAGCEKLAALAAEIPYEEAQEDLLLALLHSGKGDLIRKFAEEMGPKKFDLATEFAMMVVRMGQKSEQFQAWVKPIAAKAEMPEVKKEIDAWAAAEPGPIGPTHPQHGVMKLWDGFDTTFYDDGAQLKFGDKFSGFIVRE